MYVTGQKKGTVASLLNLFHPAAPVRSKLVFEAALYMKHSLKLKRNIACTRSTIASSGVSNIAAAVVILTASTAHASPVVNGLEISWPDDGWYQVQTADGLTNICQGMRSCLVEPGQYVVINHTTGERFTDIVVEDNSNSSVAKTDAITTVTVDGNTILWPDDGWYQVQSADTFESRCQGEESCTVADGRYIVINHTTGERFTDIVVPADSAAESAADSPVSLTVKGNIISWPDDGWYQVQSTDTYESICEGGNSCEVEAGTYVVINHTTGERFVQRVTGGADVADSASQGALALDTVSNDILYEIAGFQLEQNASFAPNIAEGIIDSSAGVVSLDAGKFTVEYRGTNYVVPTEHNQYICAGGGAMTLETALFHRSDAGYSHFAEFADYDFDNCQADVDEGVPIPDTYRLSGKLTTVLHSISDGDSQTDAKEIAHSDLDLRGELGFIITMDAEISARVSSSKDSFSSRNVTIPRYLLQLEIGDGAAPLASIENASLTQYFSDTANDGLQSYYFSASGLFSGEITDGTEVTVSTDKPLSRTLYEDAFDNKNVPFNGEIQMKASDGTQLTIKANPEEGADQSLLVDYLLLNTAGELTQSLGERFSDELSEPPF